MQINKSVGQFLQLRRTRRNFQTAELRKDIFRRFNRLDNRAVFARRAVSRKRFGGRRCPNRQIDFRRVREFAGRYRELKTRRSRFHRRNRKTNFHTIICRNDDFFPAAVCQFGIRRANRYVNRYIFVGLILNHDGQFNLIAEIHKARRGWAHHQRLFRRNRAFARTEAFARVNRNRHYAITGQIVGQFYRNRRFAVRIGFDIRRKNGERVKVLAEID